MCVISQSSDLALAMSSSTSGNDIRIAGICVVLWMVPLEPARIRASLADKVAVHTPDNCVVRNWRVECASAGVVPDAKPEDWMLDHEAASGQGRSDGVGEGHSAAAVTKQLTWATTIQQRREQRM